HTRWPRDWSSDVCSSDLENKRFVAAWKKDYGADSTTDFMAVGGYDGMAAIVAAAKATNGTMNTDKALAALKGWKFSSPRGPIMRSEERRVGKEGGDGGVR